MSTKTILLAYASRYGSTQEVAETIATTLRDAGLEVDIQPMREVKRLDAYDAVVLGAAIYNARWHPEAHQFLSLHQEALQQRPVAIFTLGPLSNSDTAKRNAQRQVEKELAKYPWLKPVALDVFGGKYDPSKPGLSFFEKLMPGSDHRDWQDISAWATGLSRQFS